MKSTFLVRAFLHLFGLFLALSSSIVLADENFIPGIYQDSTGNQYLVSGAAPSQTGRAQWSVTSTIPKVGTTNTFNLVWETGAAVGNVFLAGSTNVTTYPSGYPTGRSYGVASNTSWGYWNAGSAISASQVGTTLVINLLSNNGTTFLSTTLTYVSTSPVASTSASSTSFIAGIYQDSTGNQYLVSGAAPSQTGRTQWTVTSTIPKVGTSNTSNLVWETGAAVGNVYLAGSTNVTTYPAGYLFGRSYGVASNTSWGYWNAGSTISASQVGTTLVINLLSNNGSTFLSTTLTYLGTSPVASTSASSTSFVAGIYQDSTGNQYLLSGAAPSQTGRTQWTVTSTVPKVGTTNIFNLVWETGAAVGNTYLAGSTNATTYAAGYLPGRSYGVASNTSWGYWNAGSTISASQVGTTLVINLLSNNGSTFLSTTLTYVGQSSVATTSASSNSYLPSIYQDSTGNQYLVAGAAPSLTARVRWTVSSTVPKSGTTNTFNATWETGPAGSNSYLVGNTNVATYPAGFSLGRSYGTCGTTSWGYWNAGSVISASQVGPTLVISLLSNDGASFSSTILTAVNSGIGSATPRSINVSTRGQVQTGTNVMIGGFIIGGPTSKKVLIRAVGPNLANYGVTGVLANPMLELHNSSDGSIIASNDDWGNAANASDILATGLAPANTLESAILITLPPGAYTAVVSGSGGGTGVGIVEVYEMDNPNAPFINLSTRGQVQTGSNIMIGGFIIQGSAPQTVLIRAVGPNLSNYGVTGVLADPVLTLYSGQTVIASNDNWGTASNAAAIQAAGLAPVSPLESAILITLQPGAYTAQVSGNGGGTGVGIVEVFAQ